MPPAHTRAPAAARLLEAGELHRPMSERLLGAAARVCAAVEVAAGYAPRPEQRRVLDDAREFLLEAATRPASRDPLAGRIVLPPRTGKTVIAAHLVAHAGLTTTFVAPTRTLVDQTASELRRMLDGVPVGEWYGELHGALEHGVNVTTYAMLERAARLGRVPPSVAESALVILDEAHHTLGARRGRAVREAFDPRAPRIALTATPDYDAHRTLARTFPVLIHEVTVEEALALSLLAPLRFWVLEVDAQASTVQVIQGELDPDELGRVMSGAPFLQTALRLRYDAGNRRRPALLACCSRQQAHDVHRFFTDRRPPGTPPPALLLGTTPALERRAVLASFEAGEIDTLIQVGVLIEGWTSVRCKLLVDLAPSISRVRATQKYFRVMTRDGDTEARVYVVLPTELRAVPVLPNDLFGASQREYECGALVGDRPGGSRPGPPIASGLPIRGVRVRRRVVSRGRFAAPSLGRGDLDALREVLRACAAFDPRRPPSIEAFRKLGLEHPRFTGRGDSLMRWLGVQPTRAAYARWLARIFPEHGASLFVGDGEESEDALDAETIPYDDACLPAERARAFDGEPLEAAPDPLELAARAQRLGILRWALGAKLTRRRARILCRRFGLEGQLARTLTSIGALDEGVSRAAIGSQEESALHALRSPGVLRRGVAPSRLPLSEEEGRRPYGSELELNPCERRADHFLEVAPPQLYDARPEPGRLRRLPAPVGPSELGRFLERLAGELAPGLDLGGPPALCEHEHEGSRRALRVAWRAGPASLEVRIAEGIEPTFARGEQRTLHVHVTLAARGGRAVVLDGDARGLVAYRAEPAGHAALVGAVERAAACAAAPCAR